MKKYPRFRLTLVMFAFFKVQTMQADEQDIEKDDSHNCICPTVWKLNYTIGKSQKYQICGKEILAINPKHSGCQPEYIYTCKHSGQRAQYLTMYTKCNELDNTIKCDIRKDKICGYKSCCNYILPRRMCIDGDFKFHHMESISNGPINKERYEAIRTKSKDECEVRSRKAPPDPK